MRCGASENSIIVKKKLSKWCTPNSIGKLTLLENKIRLKWVYSVVMINYIQIKDFSELFSAPSNFLLNQ